MASGPWDNVQLPGPPNGPAWVQAAAQMMNTTGNAVNNAFNAYNQQQQFGYQQRQQNFFQNPQNQQMLQQALQSGQYAPLMQSLIQQGGTGTATQLLPQLIQQGADQSAVRNAWGNPGQTPLNTGPATNSSASGPENIHGNFTQPQLSATGSDNAGAPTLNSIAAGSRTDLDGFLAAYPKFQTLLDKDLSPSQAKMAQAAMAKYRDSGSPDRGGPNTRVQSGTGDQEIQPNRAAASNQLNPSMGEGSSAQSPRQTGERRIAQAEPTPRQTAFDDRFRGAPSEAEIRSLLDTGNRKLQAAASPRISKETAEALRDAGNKDIELAKQLQQQRFEAVKPTEKEKDLSSGTTRQAEQTAADVKYYDSLHHGHTGTGFIAAQQKQNIDVLRQVLNSNSFVPGAGGDLALHFQRWAAQLGIDPTGAAPREVFNQVAARILADQFSGMKTMAAETGEAGSRVFKSMLDIEEKANITPEDTAEGVRKKLDFLDKAGDLFKKWADKADQYKIDHGGLDAKFEKQMRDDISKARIDLKLPQAKPTSPPGNPTAPGEWREIAPGIRIREKPNIADRT